MGGIKIVEVGPRDGLQNESIELATIDKIAMIEKLADTGLKTIEMTSFVHPKWIPQLADAVDVARKVRRMEGVRYTALVPNARGLERAIEANVEEIALFLSASETHNQRNVNKAIADSLDDFTQVAEAAIAHGMRVRGYVSMVFGCPYEGSIPSQRVAELCERIFSLGVHEVSLGDTIGVANPKQVSGMVKLLTRHFPADTLAGHFHDTRGTALVNVYAALEEGLTIFDSAVGGLGGCPYAAGASGNLATEDLVYMLEGMGVDTGVNLAELVKVSSFLQDKLGRALPSKYLQSALAQKTVN